MDHNTLAVTVDAPLAEHCFYCGLQFGENPLPADDALYHQFSKYAKKTTQHFYLPGKLEDERGPQFVLAHSWCNITSRPLSHDGRLEFKDTMTKQVQEQQSPPWLHLHAVKTERLSNKAIKQRVKDELPGEAEECFYCAMPFDIVPARLGQPLYKKLLMWAKKAVQLPEPGITNKPVLVHHWCRAKTANLSPEQKLQFKTVTSAHCTGAETMPWINKNLLLKYIKSGGDLMEILKRQDKALYDAGR
ncbi:hypothetical protein BDD43_3557 [Mucilaginibacter gracilis]|uniref:Uncharacterized protein n=1 Tax=Mucilaginibacter gracilis TaxID=423350 RepID=A0A495J3U6_9SPHI|nr:hypothetical protein [Mucilaginibacter gracilis]RKR83351.1 hypothetical protein BDD43_3557 [Mucilaginibacter gracilis]